MIEMICPKCKELGQKSTITIGTGYSTLLYCPPYYDQDGKFHNHDSNSRTQENYCSMGHKILVSPSNKCVSCDFGYEEVVTVVDVPPYNVIMNSGITGLSGTVTFSNGTTNAKT